MGEGVFKMVKVIGILGEIGSGKSFIAKQFKCPVFNADKEVNKIYKKNKSCYKKLINKLPKYIKSYPINKTEITNAILANKNNIKKIVSIVRPLVRKKMNDFLKKNKEKKLVILDVPLLIENNLYKKEDILIFIDSKKNQINSRLKKRKNYNRIIKNDFKLLTIKKRVKFIKKRILNERNSS